MQSILNTTIKLLRTIVNTANITSSNTDTSININVCQR